MTRVSDLMMYDAGFHMPVLILCCRLLLYNVVTTKHLQPFHFFRYVGNITLGYTSWDMLYRSTPCVPLLTTCTSGSQRRVVGTEKPREQSFTDRKIKHYCSNVLHTAYSVNVQRNRVKITTSAWKHSQDAIVCGTSDVQLHTAEDCASFLHMR